MQPCLCSQVTSAVKACFMGLHTMTGSTMTPRFSETTGTGMHAPGRHGRPPRRPRVCGLLGVSVVKGAATAHVLRMMEAQGCIFRRLCLSGHPSLA